MILDQYGRPTTSSKYRADGWVNPVTGYGTADDNLENTSYFADHPLTWAEIEALYFSDNLIARGVEAPVKDRLARGVEYLTNDDDSEGRKKEIEDIQTDIKSLNLWNKLIEAKVFARLFRGAILYFDFGDDQNFQSSQNANKFQGMRQTIHNNQSINFELRDSQRGVPAKVWVVDAFNAFPQSYYTSHIHGADHPKLGEPEIYSLSIHTTGESRLVFAHESRCIRIDGLMLSNRQRAANLMWGNSILNRVYKVARMFGISLKAMTDTLEDFNFKSLEIKDLAEKIVDGAWADGVGVQTMLAAKSAHNQNIGVHESGTQLVKSSTTVTGLPEISSLMSNMFAAAFGIPHSRLFSAEGGAMAGTAAITDLQNYHESLRYDQTHVDTRHIERMIFLLGRDPAKFPFKFPALRESTRLEQIEERDKQADVDVKYISVNVLTPEEVAISRFSKPETDLDQTIVDFDGRGEISNDEEPTPEEIDQEQSDEERSDMFETERLVKLFVEEENE